MVNSGLIFGAVFLWLGLLFAIAFWGDRQARRGRSLIANPLIYSLSIAVYCTAWTFFGSVGFAARTGVGFLPIYLGPTLMAALWWLVLRRMILVARAQRITSIADFIGSRYGKSGRLAGLVTLIAVIGILPYISLQLKAIANAFHIVERFPDLTLAAGGDLPVARDSAFYIALMLAAFAILFGTRHLDVTERHEGLVLAIAVESVVKLIAFLAVGAWLTFVIFDGPADIFARAAARAELAPLLTAEALPGGYASWFSLTLISMAAVLFLPRQFQVAVVENVNPDHVRQASWLFPLYLLLINLFVLPMALGGMLLFPAGEIDPDTFVLSIPLALEAHWLTLLVFIGGVSAATGMVIVATVALATMISNELILPLWLRGRAPGEGPLPANLAPWVLAIRRGSILLILLLAYLYFRLIGESYALVSIGLVSFVAAAQFAPAVIIGLWWKGATRAGALAGLGTGFVIWAYTLVLPALARSGWLPMSLVEEGPWALAWLRPYALFGLEGLDPITHAVFWSLPANTLMLVLVSLARRPDVLEQLQARAFVDVGRMRRSSRVDLWRGEVSVADLISLVGRFTGEEEARRALAGYAAAQGFAWREEGLVDPRTGLVSYGEHLIAGVVGAASARVLISTLYTGQTLNLDDVMEILDETSQVMEYSRRLEQKTRELEEATDRLRAANERLRELDRMKDDFVSTVSHELRTPLTSIRSFSEILQAEPDLPAAQRQEFLQIIVDESQRLSRLIDDLLDLARLDAGKIHWKMAVGDLRDPVRSACRAVSQLCQQQGIELTSTLPEAPAMARIDRDRIQQVVLNLLSNAVKFTPSGRGRIRLRLARTDAGWRLEVRDNGPGIAPEHQAGLFDKFRQVEDEQQGKPRGSGLGLAICKGIVEAHGGRIGVDSEPGAGATFYFVLPPEEAGEDN